MSAVRFDPAHKPAPLTRPLSAPRENARCDYQCVLPHAISQDMAAVSDSLSWLSVIVPARNEALSLPQLVDEIVQALRPVCQKPSWAGSRPLGGFEIIIVNDGSTDATAAILEVLTKKIPELKAIHLQTSIGQSGATAIGLLAAQGDWIATLDADLQNDPADLVVLWNAIAGYDAALGWRTQRADTWSKQLISRLANWIRNALLGQSIYDTGCSVRLFPRLLALRLPLFQGVHRFWGPLLIREGCRIVQVPVRHRPRLHGRSHYNLRNRSLTVLVDLFGVAWLLQRPLHYEVRARDNANVIPGSYLAQLQPTRQRTCQEVA